MSTLLKQLESADKGTRIELDTLLSEIKFNADGLVPAIVQSANSREVLMLAWMNLESLKETLATGQVCYFSRSRQKLWRKGETSGHTQSLVSLSIDCDGDTLLLEVDQTGPACHTNRPNCFYFKVEGERVVVTSHPEDAT